MLDSVIVLLVAVNDNEYLATRSYLKPLEVDDGHKGIYKYSQHEKFGAKKDTFATYYIGKFGACVAAIRRIEAGAKAQGGAKEVPNMAFLAFSNIGAIIAVDVACGVENEDKMCDVLVSTQVANYDQSKAQAGRFIQRGSRINASSFLLNLFKDNVGWPNDSINPIKSRLVECNMPVPKVVPGVILSGPYLINDPKLKKQLIKDIAEEAKGIEMEGAYLFEELEQTKTHVIIVKAVCDFGDGKKHKVYQPTAALIAADLVYQKLKDPAVPKMIID